MPAAPAGRRVRVLLAALLVPCAIASVAGVLLLFPFHGAPSAPGLKTQFVHAQVKVVAAADCAQSATPAAQDAKGCLALSLIMNDGPRAGKGIVSLVPAGPGSPRYAVGDRVVLSYAGGDPADPSSYTVSDFERSTSLWVLAVLFAAAVILLGRWRGLAALVALGVSFVVLLAFVLPAILDGRNPLAVAVVGSCLIMFAVLYLSHGVSARTSTAVLGTLVSLGLIGVLGAVFTSATRLTGLDDDALQLIAALGPRAAIDPRGLLLAGFLIGALGVLDDVTVTQTSAVWELRAANPRLGAGALFAAAMRIGRDHVSSAVNTLVLAYAGAALPLMLAFTLVDRGIGETIGTQTVATEVVRTLVGSIGLVASVPITTGVAALVAIREEPASAAS
ncbi:YibE/F family protein [Pseudonocardia acaciae]|uniref:YibE/F family protein n=1 Tax=Pseudonocardia acaciae TaxID=551276 RepID=UPI00068737F6|nr:YibE/F family protein [Pseudonocardia acaciae]